MSAPDEELLDEICAAIGSLPEPLAAAATSVEVAIAEDDTTGVRKRCFELGIAVVRYGVSIALAHVAAALGQRRAPPPLAKVLSRSARMSDGSWCALLRLLAAQLEELDAAVAPMFAFAKRKPLTELVAARNRFVHDGALGDDAPAHCWAVLQEAAALLALPVVVVTEVEPPSYQERMGVPIRAGVWRKKRKPVAEHATVGAAYAVAVDRWLPLAPWLPLHDGRLSLVEGPHNNAKPWRWLDPETHERHADAELDAAVRKLMGDDAALPVAPTERPTLIGRSVAMGILQVTAEKAREGGIYVVALTGPQGIGRGRVLEAVRDSAAAFGFDTVVDASCSQHRSSLLRPLRRALSEVEGLDDVRSAIAQACSGDALAGSAGLEAAVEAVEEALVEASQQHPLLITIDDTQWADDTTLALLTLLTERASRKAKGNMLVVTGVRDQTAGSAALAQFIGEVERDVGLGATRIALPPLQRDDASKLSQGVAPLAPELSDALVAGAAGVPFYLVQSVHAWFETSALVWKDGAWHPARDTLTSEPVPGMVEVVQARLSSCFAVGSDAARVANELLLCAGLAGGWLTSEQLLAVMQRVDVPPRESEQVLEALQDAGLLAHRAVGHEYGFAQPMVQQAVVEVLRRKPWAKRVHRALLEVLSESDRADEDALFLADGFLELGDEGAAKAWLGRAVRYGLVTGLFRRAAESAERLVGLASDDESRGAARLSQVDALLRAGETSAARAVLEPAMATLTGAQAVRARIFLTAMAAVTAGDVEDPTLIADADAHGELGVEARVAAAKHVRGTPGLVLIDEAVGLLDDDTVGDLAYRVLVLRGELLAEVHGIEHPSCREAVQQTNRLAQSLGSAWASLDAQNDWALMEAAAGNERDAIQMMAQVAAKAESQHFGTLRRGALVNLATLQLRAGRPEAAAVAAAEAAAEAQRAGDTRHAGFALSVGADALKRLGKLDDARAAIDEAVAISARVGDGRLAQALLRRADILTEQEDGVAAFTDLEAALEEAVRRGSATYTARARLRLALARVDRDDDDAHEMLSELVAEITAAGIGGHGPLRRLLDVARERLTTR